MEVNWGFVLKSVYLATLIMLSIVFILMIPAFVWLIVAAIGILTAISINLVYIIDSYKKSSTENDEEEYDEE